MFSQLPSGPSDVGYPQACILNLTRRWDGPSAISATPIVNSANGVSSRIFLLPAQAALLRDLQATRQSTVLAMLSAHLRPPYECAKAMGFGVSEVCDASGGLKDGPPLPGPLLPRREERENSRSVWVLLSRCALPSPFKPTNRLDDVIHLLVRQFRINRQGKDSPRHVFRDGE